MVKEWCYLLEGGGRESVALDFSVCATVDQVAKYLPTGLTNLRKFHFPLLNVSGCLYFMLVLFLFL